MIDVETARSYYRDNDSAHGFDHVLRVLRLAERIGTHEDADPEIVRAAVLLHDIGRAEEERTGQCHAEIGAQRAREILRGNPVDEIEAVAQAIRDHRFRDGREPHTLEGKVLHDADKLDAIGAVGIARAYAVAGANGQHLWAEVAESYVQRPLETARADLHSEEHTPIHEYHFKLSKLRERMYTDLGRQMAVDRHSFMEAFFQRLGCEVTGEI